jgi:hypothetical protein
MNVLNFTERRRRQLEKMDKLDNLISGSQCKDVIAAYLFAFRKLNYNQFKYFQNSSLLDKYNVIEEQLFDIDIHLDNILYNIEGGHDPCKVLMEFTRFIDNA